MQSNDLTRARSGGLVRVIYNLRSTSWTCDPYEEGNATINSSVQAPELITSQVDCETEFRFWGADNAVARWVAHSWCSHTRLYVLISETDVIETLTLRPCIPAAY